MRPPEIEAWALDVIRRVSSGQPHEDFRVELKADWITTEKAARRLAGHANAARGIQFCGGSDWMSCKASSARNMLT
jgi:hypothetical protein